jgi:glycine/D-amino acid oxidase-like deaminating enzyme
MHTCAGASGRNGGHLWPSLDEDDGRRAFEEKGVEMLTEVLMRHGMVDGFPSVERRGGLELALDDEQMSILEAEDAKKWSSERVCEAMGAAPGTFVGAIFHPQACSIWPARAVIAIAREAMQKGANFQTDTFVNKIHEADAEGRVLVETSRGNIVGMRGVIVCANAWCPRLLPELEGIIVTARDHCVVTEPLERVWQHSFCCPETAACALPLRFDHACAL